MRVCPFTKDGSVSTKYAYKVLAYSNNANNNGKMNWKQFWRNKVSQRVLIFSQKCLHKAILVKKWINHKSGGSSTICPICKVEEETVELVLFLCNHARAVWSGSNIGFLTHSYGDLDIVEWQKNLENLNKVKGRREGPDLATMSLNTCWVLWNGRNNFIFNNIAICPNKSIRLIQKSCFIFVFFGQQ